MDIRIEEINLANQNHLNQVDFALTVDKVLDVVATGFGDTLHFLPVTAYEKRSPPDKYDVPGYIGSRDRVIFSAHADGDLAGQIILKRHWNHHAWIEEFVVDRVCRRRGVGRALMDRAREWATTMGFPAIMLETQNNRAAACCFYHDYGFKIGGYDRYLYYGTNSKPDEIAVFWYYFLREWKAIGET